MCEEINVRSFYQRAERAASVRDWKALASAVDTLERLRAFAIPPAARLAASYLAIISTWEIA